MKDLIVKRCTHCGALIRIINDCNCDNCGIMCCNEKMIQIEPNSVDASFEKHVPVYDIKDDKIVVKVNHVMDPDHFIEWICLVTDEKEEYVYLTPESEAIAVFQNCKGILYSYCNKHGLWMQKIK